MSGSDNIHSRNGKALEWSTGIRAASLDKAPVQYSTWILASCRAIPVLTFHTQKEAEGETSTSYATLCIGVMEQIHSLLP